MIICMLDMAVFPVIWSLTQVITKQPITQWNPLTLQGAGLFHLAMGAVLGIAAWGRTQEKVAGAAMNVVPPTSTPAPMPAPATPVPVTQYSVAQQPIPSYTPQYQQTPTYDQPIYVGGRLAPPPAQQPLL
jgi:hypothetical protein